MVWNKIYKTKFTPKTWPWDATTIWVICFSPSFPNQKYLQLHDLVLTRQPEFRVGNGFLGKEFSFVDDLDAFKTFM